VSSHDILFPADEIARRVRAMARDIAQGPTKPQIVVPVLAGAFVFAADLVRALADEGLSLPVEFLWLRSYGDKRSGSDVRTLVGPGEAARGRSVLLIDGVLDKGATLARATVLLREAGAVSVTTAVVVDKRLPEALLKADHAAFVDVHDFIIGYGMDDAGMSRALPYIGRVK
jgi:hypoxanthine phosphoribosyltransferase